MLRRALWALGSGALVLVCSSLAHAQCTKDTDCKGDRVCEGGKCTSPAVAPAASPPEAGPGAAQQEPGASEESPPTEDQPAAAPAAEPPAPEAPATIPVIPPEAVQSLGADEPQVRRRNRGMMIGGIVMVSV